jgi:hypothetical protein
MDSGTATTESAGTPRIRSAPAALQQSQTDRARDPNLMRWWTGTTPAEDLLSSSIPESPEPSPQAVRPSGDACGVGTWEAFDDASANCLDRIADKRL